MLEDVLHHLKKSQDKSRAGRVNLINSGYNSVFGWSPVGGFCCRKVK